MIGIPAQGDERLDAGSSAGFHIGLAEIAVIGQHGFSLAQFFRQGAGLGQHRFELLLVVGRLRHIAGDHQQTAFRHDGLSVVALLETAARNRHDARVFVRQIDLIRWARPLNRRLGRLAARLSA